MEIPWEGPIEFGSDTGLRTGLWFLESDPSGIWMVHPAWSNMRTVDEAYLALPDGDLPSQWRYQRADVFVDKLVSELRAAAASKDDDVVSLGFQAIEQLRRLTEEPDWKFPENAKVTEENGWWLEMGRFRRSIQRHLTTGAHTAHTGNCPIARTLEEWDQVIVHCVEEYAARGREAQVPHGVLRSLENVRDASVLSTVARLLDAALAGSFGVRPAECASLRDTFPTPVGKMLGCYEPVLAEAIQNIHTSEALPQLARLLDSPNEESRRRAVEGFALHALRQPPVVGFHRPQQPPPGVSREQFELYLQYFPWTANCQTNPAECIRFWKSWYRDAFPPGAIESKAR